MAVDRDLTKQMGLSPLDTVPSVVHVIGNYALKTQMLRAANGEGVVTFTLRPDGASEAYQFQVPVLVLLAQLRSAGVLGEVNGHA